LQLAATLSTLPQARTMHKAGEAAGGRRLTRAASRLPRRQRVESLGKIALRSTPSPRTTLLPARRLLSDGAKWPCAQQQAPRSLFRVSAPFSGKIKVFLAPLEELKQLSLVEFFSQMTCLMVFKSTKMLLLFSFLVSADWL